MLPIHNLYKKIFHKFDFFDSCVALAIATRARTHGTEAISDFNFHCWFVGVKNVQYFLHAVLI